MVTDVPLRETDTNGAAQPAPMPTEREASFLSRTIATLAFHTERAARFLVLLVACGLYVYASIRPDPYRWVSVGMFSVLVFAPMWWRAMFPRKES